VNTDLMFSTGKDDWATPPELFEALDREFGFALDAAANSTNHKCAAWFGPDHPVEWCRDGLAADWAWTGGPIWINPPYSRGLQGRFIERAAAFVSRRVFGVPDRMVVMLLPARTDTKAFHAHIWDAERHRPRAWVREIRFLKGRVRFVGAPASAPFPSMVVVFGAAV
jgi:phage N-6-adenine-methyltransferase